MSHYSKNHRQVQKYRSADPNCYTYVEGCGFAPPPPVLTERRILQWYSNGLGFAVLLFFFLINVMPLLLFGIFSIFQPAMRMFGNQMVASPIVYESVRVLSSSICKLLPFVLFLLLCRIPKHVAFPMRRFNPGICLSGICIALAVSVIGSFSSNFIGLLLSLLGLAPQVTGLSIPSELAPSILFGINVALIQPIIEELVFRGIVFQSLRRFGDSFALLVSAVFFSLFHGNLAQAPNAFIVGLVLGYFVLSSGSLWTGIIMHITYNTLVLCMQGISGILSSPIQELFILFIFIVYLVLGIVALLILVKQHPNMFMFIRSTTYATERMKYKVFFTATTMLVSLTFLIVSIIQNLTLV